MPSRVLIELQYDGDSSRRFVVDGRRLRWLAVLGVSLTLGLLAGGVGGGWLARSELGDRPTALAENALLRTRLHAIEDKQSQVDRALERVLAQDAKLRRLTREDQGARALGLQPLTALELAAAERLGRELSLPQEDLLRPGDPGDFEEVLDTIAQRSALLQERLEAEEVSLAEVRGYLDDRVSRVRSTPAAWPVRGWVTANFGKRRDPHGGEGVHLGLDITAPRATPVIAPADGFVVFADHHETYGNLVVLDHGYGLSTKYGHLGDVAAEVGDRLLRGDLLGQVGSTGLASAPLLHFEVLEDGVPVDPAGYLGESNSR